MERPDHLVLGAGGTLGVAWLRGVLAGIEASSRWDPREAASFVGTSAGSIVGAGLAAGRRPDTAPPAERAWAGAAEEEAVGRDEGRGWLAWVGSALGPAAAPVRPLAATAFGSLAPYALAATASGGAAVRAAALAAMPSGRPKLHQVARTIGALNSRFDGRLRVTAVDRASGRRVVFGSEDAPEASVRDAVHASCAIPWVFAPVEIGGRAYVDGGVWSPTNLDATPATRGERVLCLVPMGAPGPATSPLAFLRLATHASLLAETVAVRGRGAHVQVITPNRASAKAMGANLMDQTRVEAVLEAGRAQGRALH